MIEVEFDIQVDETSSHDDYLLDDEEIALLLDNTRAQLRQQITSKLAVLDLQEPLRVLVSGTYSLESEQLDLSYHIVTDDKQLLMQAVMALNR